ncbi:hypothetical protein FRC08_017012, partial [Ceratobasidium sp. 394]
MLLGNITTVVAVSDARLGTRVPVELARLVSAKRERMLLLGFRVASLVRLERTLTKTALRRAHKLSVDGWPRAVVGEPVEALMDSNSVERAITAPLGPRAAQSALQDLIVILIRRANPRSVNLEGTLLTVAQVIVWNVRPGRILT